MQVTFFIGSKSDKGKLKDGIDVCKKLGIDYVVHITSAHRSPERTKKLVLQAENSGCKVYICEAGMAAQLAGNVAAHTVKPVIGVPLTSNSSPLLGIDALLSTLQMPPGIPVATVAIDRSDNAAWLAAQILAITDEDLANKLRKIREENAEKIEKDSDDLQHELASQ